MTTVSIVIPTIPPRARMLPRAIASVAAQTRPVNEVIISNDLEGIGAAANRNKALASATGEWTCFVDDDDELLPQHVEHLLACAEEKRADLVYPWYQGINTDLFKVPAVGAARIGEGTHSASADLVGGKFVFSGAEWSEYQTPLGRPWDDDLETYFRSAGNFIPVTVLVRTELVRSVGGFRPIPGATDDCGDDYQCWIALLDAGAKFAHLPERTWRWNGHSGHTSGRKWTDLKEPSGSFHHF